MLNKNENLSALDIIALVGFFIGLANYNENVSQSVMDDTVKKAVNDIHNHLLEQDNKIDLIIQELGGAKDER